MSSQRLAIKLPHHNPLGRAIGSRVVWEGMRFCKSSKTIPALELFSSKAGTFWFQRRNFRIPTEELFGSKGGKFQSQGRERLIPREEFQFSNNGKFDWAEEIKKEGREATHASRPSLVVAYATGASADLFVSYYLLVG